jgi:hypothetical protein
MDLSGWIAPSGEYYATDSTSLASRLAKEIQSQPIDAWSMNQRGWLRVYYTGEISHGDLQQVTDPQVATVRALMATTENACPRAALAGFLTIVRHYRRSLPTVETERGSVASRWD